MRIIMFFILGTFLQTFAGESYSQQTKLSLEFKQVELVKVLDEIEERSEFFFLYNENLVDTERKVNLNVENKKIGEILDILFTGENVKYSITDRKIILAPKYLNGLADQNQKVTGRVTDKNGEALPGVTVLIKGTSDGTVTNFDGYYSFSEVPAKTILQFSFVGMKTIEIEVGNKTTIDVVLEDDAISIGEVVALGYQTKNKRNLTGAVTTVNVEQLENRATPRLTDMLSGAAPGLTITRKDPGRIGSSDFTMRIGGLTTKGDVAPLVIIDGIAQRDINALNDLNPQDIQSFNILKDGEAAVYGSRSAGGVIVIETKTGKDKPSFKVGITHKITTPRTYRKQTNTIQQLELLEQAHDYQNTSFFGFPGLYKYINDNNITWDGVKNNDYKYVYGPASAPFPDTPHFPFGHTDWMKVMYGNAHSQNYDFTASGSIKKLSYLFSTAVVNEKSMLKFGDNESNSYYTRVKLDYHHSDKLKYGVNLSMKYQKLTEPTRYEDARNQIAGMWSWNAPYTPEGRLFSWGGAINPIGLVTLGGERSEKIYKVAAQMYVDYKILNNLTASAKINRYADFYNQRAITKDFKLYRWDESFAFDALRNNPNSLGTVNQLREGYTGNFLLKYTQNFLENHTIRALAGYSHEEHRKDRINASRRKLISTELPSLNMGDSEEQYNSDAITEETVQSYFANVSYSFKDRYFLEGNYRNDGSSRFAPGFEWKDFYSVSGAWNVTEEEFVQNLGISNLDFLKFRVSYAELGNYANINLYDFVQTVNVATWKKDYGHVILGPSGDPIKTQFAWMDGFAAYSRTWEVAKKMNFGLDMNMFNDRLAVTANYFVTKNDNVFYSEEFPTVLGTWSPKINGAKFETKGWDLGITWNDKLSNGIEYNIGVGVSDANSTVTSLADARIIKYGYNEYVEGYAPGTIFGYDFDGIIQTEEELEAYREAVEVAPGSLTSRLYVGDAKYKDLDGDGRIEAAPYEVDENGNPTESSGDMINLGSVERHYNYFIRGGVSWKNFDFSFVLDGVGQMDTYDETLKDTDKPWIQAPAHTYGNTWTPENPNAKYPRFAQVSGDWSYHRNANNYTLSNAYYMKGNNPYLAIQNVQLGYRLPKKYVEKIGLGGLYIYANGANVGYIINKMPDGYAPEQPYAAKLTPYPATYSFGVNVNF